MRPRRWNFGGLLLAALVLAVTVSSPSVAQSSGGDDSIELIWHSAGDSYSSGEGVSGNQGDCAQASNAYGPLAADMIRADGVQVSIEAFSACTGHLVEDFFNPRPGSDKPSLSDWAAAQGLPDGRADVLTLSFGGNDIGFADIVADCLPTSDWIIGGIIGGCDDAESDLRARIDHLLDPTEACTGGRWDGGLFSSATRQDDSFDWSCQLLIDDRGTADPTDDLRGSLIDFYRLLVDEHLTPEGRLYVVGYPALFAPIGEWRAWNAFGCQGVRWGDAEKLDRLTRHLDTKLAEAVMRADAGSGRISYISRRQLFRQGSHELCGNGEDWLNGVSKNRGPGVQWARYQTSFHPNALGHQATAEALYAEVSRQVEARRDAGDDPPIFDEASTSTVMVVDVSSSMNDPSPVGQSGPKINAAIDAAQGLISVVEIDADQGAQHSVGIVAFSSSAQVVAASTTDLDRASNAAGRLQARGDTDIGDGLGQGIQTILDSAELKRIVLLSDGEITAGLSQNRVLSDVVPLAVSRGITIDVIGFAARGSLDESFLQSIASATGGNVSFAATADDLRAQFIEARHETTGTVVVNLVGELDAGSDAAISEFDVPPASSQLVVTLGYGTASEIDPVLVDPFGRTLSSRSFRVVGTNPVTVAVDDPLPGQWSVHVNEPDDSAAEDRIRWRPPVDGDQAGAVTLQTTEGEGVPYLLVVSTRAGADPDPVFGLTRRSSLPWLVAGQLALVVALLFGGFHVLSSLARSPAAARPDADEDQGGDDSADHAEPGRRRLPFVVVVGFIVGLFLLVGFLIGGFGG